MVTNTLDQGAGDESIGYGDMNFEYDFDPTVEWIPQFPEISPANYDTGVSNPDSLWETDCAATKKACGNRFYYGGYNECGRGNRVWRTFEKSQMRPDTNKVVFEGHVFCIDSWDGETFTVAMKDQNGNVMATQQRNGNNFQDFPDQERFNCEGTVGGW
jgi:hypothetical protein